MNNQNITLQVTDADYKSHSGYFSNNNCLLAAAVKRQLNTKDLFFGEMHCLINGEQYLFPRFTFEDYEKKMETKEPFSIVLTKKN